MTLQALPKRKLKFYGGAISMCSIQYPKGTSVTKRGARRGKVQTFSRQAQSRLRSLFRRINFLDYAEPEAYSKHGKGFLITTRCNHGDQPTKEQFQKMKEKFRRALLSQFGEHFGAIWKAERQRTSGTLHLHVVVLSPDEQDRQALSDYINTTWGKIIGSEDPDTNVKCLYNECSRLAGYLAKQPALEDMEWSHGKCYGQWGNLPFFQPEELDISEDYQHIIAVAVIKDVLDSRKAEKFSEKLSLTRKNDGN